MYAAPPTPGTRQLVSLQLILYVWLFRSHHPVLKSWGGGGSIPVEDNLEGEELRTIKSHLARPWTFLLSYELSSQSENVAAAAFFSLTSTTVIYTLPPKV